MWMMATFVGVEAWPFASAANVKAREGNTSKFIFKLETPKCENTTILTAAGQNVRPIVNRNIVRFSKNGYDCPKVVTALANVLKFGKDERSATMGGWINSRTTEGL